MKQMIAKTWALILFSSICAAQEPAVIGYYAGKAGLLDSFAVEKLTHVIFSFCHLSGDRMVVGNGNDSAVIRKLLALKARNPGLKVILSLGGWGGCKTCPQVFASRKGRRKFTRSVKRISASFHTDGIDLDWEYPGLSNVPGYPFSSADRPHFTLLIQRLRRKLDKNAEISFAAGGFSRYLEGSVDWKQVAPLVDRINLMTYDLVSGYDTVTGHHTPLYSTPDQLESTDHAVRFLDSIGVPRRKLVIGAAFYARIFEQADSVHDGLYRRTRFLKAVSYRNFPADLSKDSGYVYHWDSTAKAPYLYNAARKFFVSFDDTASIRLKTRYALEQGLNGIMFWQLADDSYRNGLLDVMYETKEQWLQERRRH